MVCRDGAAILSLGRVLRCEDWCGQVSTGRGLLWFFPANNKLGHKDATIVGQSADLWHLIPKLQTPNP